MGNEDPLKDLNALTVLRLFEADITARRYKQAEECLLWLLSNCSVHASQKNIVILPNYNDREVTYIATRIVAGICQMFSDPAFGIADENFYKYAIGHGTLRALLGVSGFGTADHAIENILEPLEDGKTDVVTRQIFNKVLILHGIFSGVKLPYEDYLESHPRHILWMVILAVATLFCVTEKENSARDYLIENLADKLDPTAFEAPMLGWLCIAWMHCSYATTPRRNFIKKKFNQMLVYWMNAKGIKQKQMVRPVKKNGKPVLLVINEYFKSGHAMYRCYAPTIMALRKHFYVVGMTQKNECDEESIKAFDQHFYISFGDAIAESISENLKTIKKIAPHAVYYPSVGMHITSILFANLRLAPVQFMSMGHPASSHSDVMDYCLMEPQFMAREDFFSERIFYIKNDAGMFVPHIKQPVRKELLKNKKRVKEGEPIAIIVTGSAMKLNYEFIDTLTDIQKKSDRPIEFHLIPNLNRLSLLLIKNQLQEKIKNLFMYDSMEYGEYLKVVGKCQIHLSPFPFGSTNSLVDSMLLGLPLVVLETTESEHKIDAAIIGKLKIEGLYPAKTKQEYVDMALKLINDQDFLDEMTGKIEEKEIEDVFFNSNSHITDESVNNLSSFIVDRIRNS